MGRYDAERGWLHGDRRDEARERREIAKRAFALANSSERPIEAAAGAERSPVRKAARQALTLAGDEESAKQLLATLALERQGRGGDPVEASASAADTIDKIAGDVDDQVEAHHTGEDDSEVYAAWLEWAYGLTPEQLDAKLEELGEGDAETVLETMEAEYQSDLEAYYAQDDDDEDGDDADEHGYEDGYGADYADAAGDPE